MAFFTVTGVIVFILWLLGKIFGGGNQELSVSTAELLIQNIFADMAIAHAKREENKHLWKILEQTENNSAYLDFMRGVNEELLLLNKLKSSISMAIEANRGGERLKTGKLNELYQEICGIEAEVKFVETILRKKMKILHKLCDICSGGIKEQRNRQA